VAPVRLGAGPLIEGRPTLLFCAWLAWSRFRVVIPTWDRTLGSLLACLDATLRIIGGAPTYALPDNERTITIDRVAGIGIRHPEIVAAGRHYGMEVNARVPFDPESKGGSESTVKIAKADLVPTEANLLPAYRRFGDLAAACVAFCAEVNGRVHRETARRPDDLLAIERAHLHVLPADPYTTALGVTRTVGDDQTIRLGSVRYSVPLAFVGAEAWVRVAGDEVVIVAADRDGARRDRPPPVLDARPAEARRCPLPRSSGRQRDPGSPAAPGRSGRGRLPRPGSGCARLAHRGGGVGHGPGAREDGPGGRARGPRREGAGGDGARARGGRRSLRRG